MERQGGNGSCRPGPGGGQAVARANSGLAAVLIVTIVVDVLGNALVILSVLRNKKLRNAAAAAAVAGNGTGEEMTLRSTLILRACMNPPGLHMVRGNVTLPGLCGVVEHGNIFVVSLSVADLVVAVYPYPLILSAIFHNGWTMGNVHCQISGFLMGLSVIGSIFNITAIAINRYCYICHSLRYDKLFNLKNTCCYICLTWLLTVVAIVPNFFVGSLQYDPRIYSCTFAQTVSTSYTIAVVVVHFIVPLSIVTFCYLRIWILVIQVKHRVRQDCKQKLRAADVRNFLTMFVVFVLFAVCWGPLNFIGLAVSINPSKVQPHIPEWLFVLSYFMAYFNSCLNAVIYGLLNQNFRKEYKRILLTLRTPRLLFIDVSKGGTEGLKSKPSPAVTNNNNQAEIHL